MKQTLLVLLICSSWNASPAISIQGHLQIVDEHGNDNRPGFLIPADMRVRFYLVKKDGASLACEGESLVSSGTYEFEDYTVPTACAEGSLEAALEMSPDFGWQQTPDRTEVVPGFEVAIRVIRQQNPDRATRVALLTSAKAKIESDPDTASALLAEAARGTDLEFTAVGAALLEKNGLQRNVVDLFADKDIGSLETGDSTKFAFWVRKGNSARAQAQYSKVKGSSTEALGAFGTALASYSKAQEVYPQNRQVISMAMATAKEAVDAEDYRSDFQVRLAGHPELTKELAGVYMAWDASAEKPRFIDPEVPNEIQVNALDLARGALVTIPAPEGLEVKAGPDVE